jgi:hypothetical protein
MIWVCQSMVVNKSQALSLGCNVHIWQATGATGPAAHASLRRLTLFGLLGKGRAWPGRRGPAVGRPGRRSDGHMCCVCVCIPRLGRSGRAGRRGDDEPKMGDEEGQEDRSVRSIDERWAHFCTGGPAASTGARPSVEHAWVKIRHDRERIDASAAVGGLLEDGLLAPNQSLSVIRGKRGAEGSSDQQALNELSLALSIAVEPQLGMTSRVCKWLFGA